VLDFCCSKSIFDHLIAAAAAAAAAAGRSTSSYICMQINKENKRISSENRLYGIQCFLKSFSGFRVV
jgi:hypothetical protein